MKFRVLIAVLTLFVCAIAPSAMAQKSGTTSKPADAKASQGSKDASKHKNMPARDPKTGKFVKSTGTSKGSATAKTLPPPRDPKTGRFVKSTGTAKSGSTAKSMPARDPKTGRFVKSTGTAKSGSTAKSTPARDPKTGRFVKSTDKSKTDKSKTDKSKGGH